MNRNRRVENVVIFSLIPSLITDLWREDSWVD